jgi:hypothetical protein
MSATESGPGTPSPDQGQTNRWEDVLRAAKKRGPARMTAPLRRRLEEALRRGGTEDEAGPLPAGA